MAQTTVYLHIEPTFGRYAFNRDQVESIRVTGTTVKRPNKIRGVCVRLTLQIPDGAFKPLQPTVVIDVPESALEYEPKVTVEMPEGEE